jgi:transcriptional regulator with XRE-family HTH domain
MVKDFRGLQERLRRRILAEIAAGELTGLELARRTGFQQAHISNFLNRKRGLSLEAMDEILKVRGLSVGELIGGTGEGEMGGRTIHASSEELAFIPLVEAKNCLASEVPLSEAKDTLRVMSSRLQKLPVKMRIPRPHWQRFVATRVGTSDAQAMAPRLPRGTVAVIDRHSNEAMAGSIYMVRVGRNIVMRYVERVGEEWVLRAEDVGVPLVVLESAAGIVGRVCLVIEEM